MKLVIDANVLFASLIRPSLTAQLLFDEKITLYAPEFLMEEFKKYEKMILEKTSRTNEEFNEFLERLKNRIQIVPKTALEPFLRIAKKEKSDPNDNSYVALSLKLKIPIWSNDKDLKTSQSLVKVYSTAEIMEILSSTETHSKTDH